MPQPGLPPPGGGQPTIGRLPMNPSDTPRVVPIGPPLGPPIPAVPPAAPTLPLPADGKRSLKDELVQLSIITAADWDDAVAALGGQSDPNVVLEQLTRMPASWTADGDTRPSALTQFQFRQIKAGNAHRLRLQHYVILDRLGAGGMGEVFTARNLNLPRLEAIKTFIQDIDDGLGAPSEGIARFDQEARLLAQLNHPFITHVNHAGRDHGVAFIAMEYVRGQTLKQIVEQANAENNPVPIWWAVERIAAVADALKHAHAKKIIHRDIKPQNIMITETNELKVLDLGIARLVGSGGSSNTMRLTQESMGLGTPEVMPPEQWADASAVTAESDLYSLGCTLFFLLTGRMPFVSESINGYMFAHVNDPPPAAATLRPEVPKALDDVIAKMLAKNAIDRFHDCDELIKALQASIAPEPDEELEDEEGFSPTRIPWLGLGAIAAALIVAGVIYSVMPPRHNGGGGGGGGGGTPIAPGPDFRKQALEWLQEHQQKNREVWITPLQLDQFAQEPYSKVASESDLAQLKAFVQTETDRRLAVLAALHEVPAQFSSKEKTVWPNPKELEGFAGPIEQELAAAGFPEDSVTRLLTRIGEETKKRWRGRADKWLGDLQTRHPKIWGKLGDLVSFLGQKPMPIDIDAVASDASFEAMSKKAEAATWERESEEWAFGFRATRQAAWPSDAALKKFIGESFPSGITTEEELTALKKAVEEKSRMLLVERSKKLIADFQEMHADFWPNPDLLQTEAEKWIRPEEYTDDSALKRLTDELAKQTLKLLSPTPPVLVAKIEPDADPKAKADAEKGAKHRTASAEALIALFPLLLGLPESEGEAKGELVVKTLVEGKDLRRVPLGKRVTVQVQSADPGYVSLLTFGDNGKPAWFCWNEKLRAGRDAKLLIYTADAVGKDQLIVLVTDIKLGAEAPRALRDMQTELQLKSKDPAILRDHLVPPAMLEADDLPLLIKAYGQPKIYPKIRELLIAGTKPSFMPPQTKIKQWKRTFIEVQIVKE